MAYVFINPIQSFFLLPFVMIDDDGVISIEKVGSAIN